MVMSSAGQTFPVLTPGTGGLYFSTPLTLTVTCLSQLKVRRDKGISGRSFKSQSAVCHTPFPLLWRQGYALGGGCYISSGRMGAPSLPTMDME